MPDQERSEHERAAEEMREFEQRDELPRDLTEWPSGKAKYITFGEQDDDAYGEGVTSKLGPGEVIHHEDGTVTVGGEEADPADYKGDEIKSPILEQIEDSKNQ